MKVLTVYLRIYADAFQQALTGIRKNAWTLLLPIGLLLAWGLVRGTLASIGLGQGWVGGIVLGLVLCAVISCYLYFVGEVVAKSRVKLEEFGRSIRAYFWSVANLFFVYWVASLIIDVLVPGPQKGVFSQLLFLAGVILLNAAPEVIYQRGSYGGLETVQRSIRFLQANWIEWGIPNLLILAVWWFIPRDPLWSLGTLGTIITALVEGALLHLVMVFRGHLFAALDGTSHRQRMYRWRSTGVI
jgi:hypothetical protein